MTRWLWIVFMGWGLLLASAVVCRAEEQASTYRIDSQPPAWVVPHELPELPAVMPLDKRAGYLYLLLDRQERFAEGKRDRYIHVAKKFTSAAGIHDGSELFFKFEPQTEQLTIHFIRLHRGEQIRDVLSDLELRTIQQEQDLERRLYDGTLTVMAFLEDVRQGDVIEFAYSRKVDNPVLRGHFISYFFLARSSPIVRLHNRLLWPRNRKIHIRNHLNKMQPKIQTLGKFREYRWDLEDTKAIDVDDHVPDWYEPFPEVYVTDFSGWNQVASWAEPLYRTPEKLPPEMSELVNRWRQENPTLSGRLQAALRFVQDHVRYLGIEIGPHGLKPHDPVLVFRRRFGDCKDKTLLLVTLLRHLGVQADATLVSTTWKHVLDDMQPSPWAFNHAIVRAQVDKNVFWLDPTISFQRGTLKQIDPPDYRRALVINKGTQDLEVIPIVKPKKPQITVKEFYKAASFDAPATLKVTTKYRGGDANYQRKRFATESKTSIEKTYLNHYAQVDHKASLLAPAQITDDTKKNEFLLAEEYKIPDFWEDGEREIKARETRSYLRSPTVTQRSMPFELNHPTYVQEIIEVELPHDFGIENEEKDFGNDFLHFWYKASYHGRILTLEFTLKTLSDHVPADKIEEYLALLEDIRSWTYYVVEDQGFRFPWVWLWWLLGTLAVGTIGTTWVVLRTQRKPALTGRQGMIGEVGRACCLVNQKGGKIFVHGEYWNAFTEGDEEIQEGKPAEVVEVLGMNVRVKNKETTQ
jgi:membrane protein implicated in regulation of membrane protease activity